MSTPYIPINTSPRLGNQLRVALDTFRTARDQLNKLVGVMAMQIDSSGGSGPSANYAQLESLFGLQTGQGYTLWFQVSSVSNALQSNEQLSNLADQVNQLLAQTG